jgi:hypothetical protein
MRGEPDYALHEASPFGAARLLLIPNPAEGQHGFAAEIVRAGPFHANPIEGQP